MFGWMLRRLLRPWGGEHGLPDSIGPIFRAGDDAIFHSNRSLTTFAVDEPGRHFVPERDGLLFESLDDGSAFRMGDDGAMLEADAEPPIFQPVRGLLKFAEPDGVPAYQTDRQPPDFDSQETTDFPYPDPR